LASRLGMSIHLTASTWASNPFFNPGRSSGRPGESLRRLTTGQLREKYLEIFGEESRSNHKQFLFRRIARRIKASPT